MPNAVPAHAAYLINIIISGAVPIIISFLLHKGIVED